MSFPCIIHGRFSGSDDGKPNDKAGEDVLKLREKCTVAIAIMLAAWMPSATVAQDSGALPDTPKELRDFRLDPQNAPATETPKQVTPPPVTPTVEPQPKQQATPQQTRPQSQPEPRRTETVRAPQPREQAPRQAVPEEQMPEPVVTDEVLTEPVLDASEPSAETVTPEAASVAAPETTGSSFPSWLLWLAGAIVAIGAAAFLLLRRGKAEDEEVAEAVLPATPTVPTEPEIPEAAPVEMAPAETVSEVEPEPAVVPEPVAAPKAKKKKAAAAKRPLLDVTFTPVKAVISIANLTVSGKMRIANSGDVAAEAMKLRIVLTSAQQGQPEMVANFHSDAPNMPGETIGSVNAGEDLNLSIDLQVPLSELRSYPVGNQQLFVPLIVANLAYGWDGAEDVDTVETACLIGKEASPPQPKMGALRLDLGPRSFDGLGQRPLAA